MVLSHQRGCPSRSKKCSISAEILRAEAGMDRRYDPKLNKKRYLIHAECTIYTVNGLAVRNASKADEEFGNFACHDEYPDAIGEREVWISEKLASREGVFFAANALTYLAKIESAPNAA